jgi:hypothetical protein
VFRRLMIDAARMIATLLHDVTAMVCRIILSSVFMNSNLVIGLRLLCSVLLIEKYLTVVT